MCARRYRLFFAPRAEEDYDDILLYSLINWGEDQALIYKVAMDTATDTLLDHPHIGRARNEIGTGYRSFQVRQHVVYYRVASNTLEVLRILHYRQDTAGQVDDPD